MLTEAFCTVIFSVINWMFGWIPATQSLMIADKVTYIFGYGVWVLGDQVFTAVSVIGMAELTGLIAWSLVVFVFNKIRGC